MKVLGVDTSTPQAAIALTDGDALVAEARLPVRRGEAERLLPAIDRLLSDARVGLAELSGVGVAIGPGSFTGLRIGLATVKGLALGAGLRVVGVPSLDALAWQVPWALLPVVPLLDARRGEVYGARFEPEAAGALARVTEDAALDLEGLAALVGDGPALLVGPGADAWREAVTARLGLRARFVPSALVGPRGLAVARLAAARLAAGEADPVDRLVPRYVRGFGREAS
ncbi:MAG TPA: tRNA (adenosine(37)-N6)-threonylcarbamoyltransferase complex dimerization subunit type 1 TsaB [Thermodesulfobacteriota bacterium]